MLIFTIYDYISGKSKGARNISIANNRVVVLMRVRLLLTALVFQVKYKKRRKIVMHCNDQS